MTISRTRGTRTSPPSCSRTRRRSWAAPVSSPPTRPRVRPSGSRASSPTSSCSYHASSSTYSSSSVSTVSLIPRSRSAIVRSEHSANTAYVPPLYWRARTRVSGPTSAGSVSSIVPGARRRSGWSVRTSRRTSPLSPRGDPMTATVNCMASLFPSSDGPARPIPQSPSRSCEGANGAEAESTTNEVEPMKMGRPATTDRPIASASISAGPSR